jgi:hypothetical protein
MVKHGDKVTLRSYNNDNYRLQRGDDSSARFKNANRGPLEWLKVEKCTEKSEDDLDCKEHGWFTDSELPTPSLSLAPGKPSCRQSLHASPTFSMRLGNAYIVFCSHLCDMLTVTYAFVCTSREAHCKSLQYHHHQLTVIVQYDTLA